MKRGRAGLFLGIVAAAFGGCITESHRSVATPTVASHNTPYSGPKYALIVANFENRSQYLRGAFADAGDPLGSQAKTILKTHLQLSSRFVLLDRDNMEEIARESKIRGAKPELVGAQVALTGNVTEFGRRETGDIQLFGILGYGKQQLAYAKVALNVVDVDTSKVVFAVQGAGEFELGNREVAGFGTVAGYDATLNGKVLNLAITEAVNNLVAALERGEWSPARAR